MSAYEAGFPTRVKNRTKYTAMVGAALCTCGLIPGGMPLETKSWHNEVVHNGFWKGLFRVNG